MNINIFQELQRLRSRFGRCATVERKSHNNSPFSNHPGIAPRVPDKPEFRLGLQR